MKDWSDEERELYTQSRLLKEKARGLRAKRLAAEERAAQWCEMQRAIKDSEAEARLLKAQRDDRIRKALLDMARIAKAHNLAFECAPDGQVKFGFHLIDRKPGSIGNRYAINVTPDGFQWD